MGMGMGTYRTCSSKLAVDRSNEHGPLRAYNASLLYYVQVHSIYTRRYARALAQIPWRSSIVRRGVRTARPVFSCRRRCTTTRRLGCTHAAASPPSWGACRFPSTTNSSSSRLPSSPKTIPTLSPQRTPSDGPSAIPYPGASSGQVFVKVGVVRVALQILAVDQVLDALPAVSKRKSCSTRVM